MSENHNEQYYAVLGDYQEAVKVVALLIQEHGYRVGQVAKYLRRDQAHMSTMLSRLSVREKERDRVCNECYV